MNCSKHPTYQGGQLSHYRAKMTKYHLPPRVAIIDLQWVGVPLCFPVAMVASPGSPNLVVSVFPAPDSPLISTVLGSGSPGSQFPRYNTLQALQVNHVCFFVTSEKIQDGAHQL